jgi:hypothetical protein
MLCMKYVIQNLTDREMEYLYIRWCDCTPVSDREWGDSSADEWKEKVDQVTIWDSRMMSGLDGFLVDVVPIGKILVIDSVNILINTFIDHKKEILKRFL